MIKLGVITDEVSQSLSEVVAFARQYGLSAVELRSVEGLGPFQWDDSLVARMAQVFREEGLAVCCLSLPFFKCALADTAVRAAHIETLARSLAHAGALGCGLVRGFCFWREARLSLPLCQIVEAYAPVLPLLRDAGITLVLESDPAVYGHTARDLAAILQAIDSPHVRALWDGGNLLFIILGVFAVVIIGVVVFVFVKKK